MSGKFSEIIAYRFRMVRMEGIEVEKKLFFPIPLAICARHLHSFTFVLSMLLSLDYPDLCLMFNQKQLPNSETNTNFSICVFAYVFHQSVATKDLLSTN